jgi:acyl-CoA reductase-like NAD-dependent aldehyde dehydrogenase
MTFPRSAGECGEPKDKNQRLVRLVSNPKRSANGSGPVFQAVNPFLGEPFAEVSSASPSDVDAAVNAAAAAWESWRRVSGAHRGELLYKLADVLTREHDRLARIETQDNGKIIRETRNQLLFAARCYRFFAGAADKLAGETKPSIRATSTAPWFSTSM